MKRIGLHIGASCAVTLFFANLFGNTVAVVIASAAAVLLVISLLLKKTRQALVLPIVAGAALFSCLVFLFSYNTTVAPIQQLDGVRAYSTFRIIDIEQKTTSGSGYKYTIKTSSVAADNTLQDIKVTLYSSAYIEADYYDDISAYLTFYTSADNGFDSYGEFGDGIYINAYTDYNESDFYVEENTDKPLNYYFIKLRQNIKKNTAYLTNGGESALAYAILTGDRSELADNISSDFQICGATHITAVSGLHITMICLGFYYVIKRLLKSPLLSALATLAVLLTYAAVADFSQSVIRAVIMTCVFIFAPVINKKADSLNSLGTATFIMCLNPFSATDAGAVMSVCAVLGIGLLRPALAEKIKPKSAIGAYLTDAIITSVSVAVTTFVPIIIFFKQVSFIMIFLNVVLISFAQATLCFALGYNIFMLIFGRSFIFKWGMLIFGRAIILIVSFCAEKFSFLCIDASDAGFFIAAGLCFLFCAINIFLFRRIDAGRACILLALMLTLCAVFGGYKSNREVILEVTENNAVIAYTSDSIAVIDADERADYYSLRNITQKRNIENSVFVNCDYDMASLEALTQCEDVVLTEDKYHLCKQITVKYSDDGTIVLQIYTSTVTISDDTVEALSCTAYRNASDKFGDNRNYVFTFSYNSTVTLRRETNA